MTDPTQQQQPDDEHADTIHPEDVVDPADFPDADEQEG